MDVFTPKFSKPSAEVWGFKQGEGGLQGLGLQLAAAARGPRASQSVKVPVD